MASDGEISCTNDPNFAVIYSFLKVFGKSYSLNVPSIAKLQELLENTEEVLEPLKELHLRLLRRALRSVQGSRWERGLIKFCHQHGHHQEAWEIERFSYKKASTQVKLKVLKFLLEYQFTCHPKFKNTVNAITSKELRLDPVGRDQSGCVYWLQTDHEANLCLYREDQDEETWQLIARNREELVNVIAKLKSGEEVCPSAACNDNEDSNNADVSAPESSTEVLPTPESSAAVLPTQESSDEVLPTSETNAEVLPTSETSADVLPAPEADKVETQDDNEEEFFSPESESEHEEEFKKENDEKDPDRSPEDPKQLEKPVKQIQGTENENEMEKLTEPAEQYTEKHGTESPAPEAEKLQNDEAFIAKDENLLSPVKENETETSIVEPKPCSPKQHLLRTSEFGEFSKPEHDNPSASNQDKIEKTTDKQTSSPKNKPAQICALANVPSSEPKKPQTPENIKTRSPTPEKHPSPKKNKPLPTNQKDSESRETLMSELDDILNPKDSPSDLEKITNSENEIPNSPTINEKLSPVVHDTEIHENPQSPIVVKSISLETKNVKPASPSIEKPLSQKCEDLKPTSPQHKASCEMESSEKEEPLSPDPDKQVLSKNDFRDNMKIPANSETDISETDLLNNDKTVGESETNDFQEHLLDSDNTADSSVTNASETDLPDNDMTVAKTETNAFQANLLDTADRSVIDLPNNDKTIDNPEINAFEADLLDNDNTADSSVIDASKVDLPDNHKSMDESETKAIEAHFLDCDNATDSSVIDACKTDLPDNHKTVDKSETNAFEADLLDSDNTADSLVIDSSKIDLLGNYKTMNKSEIDAFEAHLLDSDNTADSTVVDSSKTDLPGNYKTMNKSEMDAFEAHLLDSDNTADSSEIDASKIALPDNHKSVDKSETEAFESDLLDSAVDSSVINASKTDLSDNHETVDKSKIRGCETDLLKNDNTADSLETNASENDLPDNVKTADISEIDASVSDEIEEPLMIVTGEGNGADCESSYFIGEEICEQVMYFFGEGNGYDNDTGNPEAITENEAETSKNGETCMNGETQESVGKTRSGKRVKLKTKLPTVTKRSLKKQCTDSSETLKPDTKKHCVRNLDNDTINSRTGRESRRQNSVNEKSTDNESPNKNNVKKGRGRVRKKPQAARKLKIQEPKDVAHVNTVGGTGNGNDSKTSIIEKRKSSLSEDNEEIDGEENDKSSDKELKVEETLPPKKLRLETTPESDVSPLKDHKNSTENADDDQKNEMKSSVVNTPIAKRKKIKAAKGRLKRKVVQKNINQDKESDKKNDSNSVSGEEESPKVKNKSLKRSLVDATLSDKSKSESQSEREADESVTSGKRLKIKPKKLAKSSRKKVEEKINEKNSSDESEEETLYSIAGKKSPKKVLKKKCKSKKSESKANQKDVKNEVKPAGAKVEDDITPVRQSRRIAQLKIREEAERRHMEEVALRELKMIHKKKTKDEEDEEVDWKASGKSSSDSERVSRKKTATWRASDSTGPDADSESDEPLFEHPEPNLEFTKSDHEFSPESDLESGEPSEPLKRARTLQEEKDDGFCKHCGSAEQPEWILLCDRCDAGYHASCLKPLLLLVPPGDWFCPPCNHEMLIASLEKELVKYDELVVIAEAERARRKLEEPVEKVVETKEKEEDSESGSDNSSWSSSSSEGAVYRLRARKQLPVSYRAREYDRLISTAIKEEYVEPTTSAGNQGRGKDISTIIEAAEEEKLKAEREAIEQGKPLEKKKKKQRRKPRKLNSLDVPSEDDDETDEDFKDTGLESSSEEISSSAERGGSSQSNSSDDIPIARRASRPDREERSKLTESSPEVKKKKKGVLHESSSEGENRSAHKKSKSKSRRRDRSDKKRSRKRRGLQQYDAEGNVIRARVTYGGLSGDESNDWSPKHRTRQKKINYTEMPNTESEDEMHKSSGKHMQDSSDEFKVEDSELDSSDSERAKRRKEEESEAMVQERRQALDELIKKTAIVPLEKLPEEVTTAKTKELQAHLDMQAAGVTPTPPRPLRGRGSRGGRGGGRGRGRASKGAASAQATDGVLSGLVGVTIKAPEPTALKPLDPEREKKRLEREAKLAEKEQRKLERLQKKEEKEKLKELKAKEREEKKLARLALQESKRMKRENPSPMGGFGRGMPPEMVRAYPPDFQEQRFPPPPRLQVRAELRGVLPPDGRPRHEPHPHPAMREGTLSVAGSPQPFKPASDEPSIITRMPHMINQQYRSPIMYNNSPYGPRGQMMPYMHPGLSQGMRQYPPQFYSHMRGLPPGYPNQMRPGHPGPGHPSQRPHPSSSPAPPGSTLPQGSPHGMPMGHGRPGSVGPPGQASPHGQGPPGQGPPAHAQGHPHMQGPHQPGQSPGPPHTQPAHGPSPAHSQNHRMPAPPGAHGNMHGHLGPHGRPIGPSGFQPPGSSPSHGPPMSHPGPHGSQPGPHRTASSPHGHPGSSPSHGPPGSSPGPQGPPAALHGPPRTVGPPGASPHGLSGPHAPSGPPGSNHGPPGSSHGPPVSTHGQVPRGPYVPSHRPPISGPPASSNAPSGSNHGPSHGPPGSTHGPSHGPPVSIHGSHVTNHGPPVSSHGGPLSHAIPRHLGPPGYRDNGTHPGLAYRDMPGHPGMPQGYRDGPHPGLSQGPQGSHPGLPQGLHHLAHMGPRPHAPQGTIHPHPGLQPTTPPPVRPSTQPTPPVSGSPEETSNTSTVPPTQELPIKIKAEVKTEQPEYHSPLSSPTRSVSPKDDTPRNHPKIKVTENKDRRPRFPLGPYAPQFTPYGPYAPPAAQDMPGAILNLQSRLQPHQTPLQRMHQIHQLLPTTHTETSSKSVEPSRSPLPRPQSHLERQPFDMSQIPHHYLPAHLRQMRPHYMPMNMMRHPGDRSSTLPPHYASQYSDMHRSSLEKQLSAPPQLPPSQLPAPAPAQLGPVPLTTQQQQQSAQTRLTPTTLPQQLTRETVLAKPPSPERNRAESPEQPQRPEANRETVKPTDKIPSGPEGDPDDNVNKVDKPVIKERAQEGSVFGGLVSYFSSQHEDEMDS